MPIQPVLGHKPITSYFSRSSSTKRKRKESDKPASSTDIDSKRPKQSASSSCPSNSKLANTRTSTGNVHEGLRVTKEANDSCHSSRQEVDPPSTPLDNHSGRQGMDGTLPTPPMTCVAPSRYPRFSERDQSSSPPSSEPSPCREDKLAVTSLPTSSLPPRFLKNTSLLPSMASASSLVVSNSIDAASTMPGLTIPSSQSQDHPCMTVEISQFSGKLPPLRPTEREDLIIESSQSQLLIMASPIVRTLELEPTLPALDSAIPSSQSQEKELTIPTEKDVATGARGRCLDVIAQKEIEVPQRTLSDELFSIPIRNSILDDIFSDEQALDRPTDDSGNPQTSADLEDEHEGFPDSCYPARSLAHTSWSTAERASTVSQSSLEAASYSSLPPEVREFRQMFENGDESYPADFPESLRA